MPRLHYYTVIVWARSKQDGKELCADCRCIGSHNANEFSSAHDSLVVLPSRHVSHAQVAHVIIVRVRVGVGAAVGVGGWVLVPGRDGFLLKEGSRLS